jgi:hypothetical protein
VAHNGIGVIPYDGDSLESWDAARELRKIAEAVPNGAFEEQLGFIQEQALSSFSTALKRYSGNLANNPHFTIMLVKQDSTGRVYFGRQEFTVVCTPLTADQWVHRAEANPIQMLVNGESGKSGVWWDVAPQCRVALPLSIDLSPKEAITSISTIIRGVANQSAYCSQRIGEPIRAAISDASGARWLSN